MECQVSCPKCGATGCVVSEERVRPDLGPVPAICYVVGMALVAWQGMSRMARPYTTQSAYGVAVAMMVLSLVGMVVLSVIFVRMRRARPCRVQRCPRCGHAVALDPAPKYSRGWRVR